MRTLATAMLLAFAGPALAGPAPAWAAAARTPARLGQRIVIGNERCALRWTAPDPGRARFTLVNTAGTSAGIYLLRATSDRVVAHVRELRPGARRALVVKLGPGSYVWSCAVSGRPIVTSDTATVPFSPATGRLVRPPLVPVSPGQLAGPLAGYRAYAERELRASCEAVAALRVQLQDGELDAARETWLAAHLDWSRIGAAYEAFGTIGLAIDGTAARLPEGVASPRFTGFHRLELDLWDGAPLSSDESDASTLEGLLDKLRAELPHLRIAAIEVPIRAHEVLEDDLRDELTGADEYGSGTDLASVEAGVEATRELVSLVAPLIAPRAPSLLGTASSELTRLQQALLATLVEGRWVPVPALSLGERERVDGAIDAALETLSAIPDLLSGRGSA